MKTISATLALLFPLALAACGETPTAALSPDDAAPRRVILLGCVEFNPPPAGTIFGSSVGTPAGIPIFSEVGINVSVTPFTLPGGAVVYGDMMIDPAPPVPFGAGKTAHTRDINVGFDFTGLPPVTAVEVEWLDQGGAENLYVNGAGPFIGELDTPPAILGGIGITRTVTAVPGGDRGRLRLTGPVSRMRVGGRNLWIDRVCAYQ